MIRAVSKKNRPWPVWEGLTSVQLRTTLVEMDAPLSWNDKGVWLLIIRPAAGLNGPENSVTEQTGRQAGFKYWALNSGGSCHSADVHTADLHPQFQITAHIGLFWMTLNPASLSWCNRCLITTWACSKKTTHQMFCFCFQHISVTVCALNELRKAHFVLHYLHDRTENMQLHNTEAATFNWNYIYILLNGFAK